MPREKISKSELLESLRFAIEMDRDLISATNDDRHVKNLEEDLTMFRSMLKEEMPDNYPKRVMSANTAVS